MAAGYSKRSLADKIGIKPGTRILILDAPRDYRESLGPLPRNTYEVAAFERDLDLIHFFTKSKSDLVALFKELKKALSVNGMLWISWPKGSSKVKTDLNENIIRDIGLKYGLVDVKVCAVDETWSGLKFVYRLENRGKGSKPKQKSRSARE